MFEQSAMNVFFIATCPAIGSGAGRRPRDSLCSCPCLCPCPCPCLCPFLCPCPCSCSSCLGSWRLCQCALISVWYTHTHTQSQTKALPLNWAAVAPAQRCHIWFLLEAASEIGAFNGLPSFSLSLSLLRLRALWRTIKALAQLLM